MRDDGRKSSVQVLHDCERLLKNYHGSLERLHATAADARDLEEGLFVFHGVGPVTANIIFVRTAAILAPDTDLSAFMQAIFKAFALA